MDLIVLQHFSLFLLLFKLINLLLSFSSLFFLILFYPEQRSDAKSRKHNENIEKSWQSLLSIEIILNYFQRGYIKLPLQYLLTVVSPYYYY